MASRRASRPPAIPLVALVGLIALGGGAACSRRPSASRRAAAGQRAHDSVTEGMVQSAEWAYAHEKYDEAKQLADSVLKLRADGRAAYLAGAARCKLGDAEGARAYAQGLEVGTLALVARVCAEAKIQLSPSGAPAGRGS